MTDTAPPQTVLITGAARRIGRALALDLAAHGWQVAVHYHGSAEDAAATVAMIEQAGGRAFALAADLADEAQATRLLARAGDHAGAPITALINNASVFEQDHWHDASRQGWDLHMAVNLRAPFVLSQAMAHALPAAMTGAIINIIDQRVWRLRPDFMTYTLSKSGLWTLTQTLAQALAPRIRVNAIGPGPVLRSIHQGPQDFAAEAAAVPLGHGPSLAEIGDAARFILAATSMTGQMIALDGGQHLAWTTPETGDRHD
ncbi:MAG: SDR family oxidoreductase [Sphingomonadales bacterium]